MTKSIEHIFAPSTHDSRPRLCDGESYAHLRRQCGVNAPFLKRSNRTSLECQGCTGVYLGDGLPGVGWNGQSVAIEGRSYSRPQISPRHAVAGRHSRILQDVRCDDDSRTRSTRERSQLDRPGWVVINEALRAPPVPGHRPHRPPHSPRRRRQRAVADDRRRDADALQRGNPESLAAGSRYGALAGPANPVGERRRARPGERRDGVDTAHRGRRHRTRCAGVPDADDGRDPRA